MRLELLYFAQLRERFGMAQESLLTPESIHTVADLIAHLSARGGVWAETFTQGTAFRVAMNQDMVTLDTALQDGAEVAIFRPVTGG